jgi:hypothetical protein
MVAFFKAKNEKLEGLNVLARGLEARIAQNVAGILEV